MATRYQFELFDLNLHSLSPPIPMEKPYTFNAGDVYIFNPGQFSTITKVGHLVHRETNGDFTYTTWVQVSPPQNHF